MFLNICIKSKKIKAMMARLSLPTSFGHQKEVGWATKLNHSQT
jgi:hypothetical protein